MGHDQRPMNDQKIELIDGLRAQWMIKRLTKVMGAALVGNKI